MTTEPETRIFAKSLDDKCMTMRIVPSTALELTGSASVKHQVPRRPSTCTPTPHGNAKYPSCRQDLQVGPLTIDVAWTVYNYRRPKDVGFIKYLSETNVNDYHRKNGTGKSEDPKYHDTDDMNGYENSCNDKHVPLPSP